MTRNEWMHQTAMHMLAADPELDADFIADTVAEVADAVTKKAPFDNIDDVDVELAARGLIKPDGTEA